MSVIRSAPRGRPPGLDVRGGRAVVVAIVIVTASILGVLSAVSGRVAVGVGVAIAAVPVLLGLWQTLSGHQGGSDG